MDLRYSEEDEKFRAELRSWLEGAVPAHGDPPPVHDWDARRAYDTSCSVSVASRPPNSFGQLMPA